MIRLIKFALFIGISLLLFAASQIVRSVAHADDDIPELTVDYHEDHWLPDADVLPEAIGVKADPTPKPKVGKIKAHRSTEAI